MIIPDVNLLLYAEFAHVREHARARSWWKATNPRMFTRPMSTDQAVDCIECWMERPNVHRVDGGPRHLEICFRLLRELGTGANLTTDVQLAAIAMELNSTLYTNDGDFRRIKGLRWVNPLES